MHDSEVVAAIAAGDPDGLAEAYDRYAAPLYTYCRSLLREPADAADAVQDTFVIAATRLPGLRDPSRLKPWLCAIARHESIRRSSKRARTRPSVDEVLEVPVADESARGLMAEDAASLVWEAADALTERERAVLVLNVRQGLEGADLAAAAGLTSATTSVVLSRAKTQLATAVRCTLLIRGGRDDCAELAQIVPRKHAAIDGLTRKRVARHAAECPICVDSWNKTPEALGVLAAAPLVGAPVALRHQVLNDPRLISFSAPLGTGAWQRDGFPPAEPEDSRRRIFGGLAAAAVAIAVAAALMLVASNDDARSLASPRAPRTTTTDVEDFAPWPTDPPTTTPSTSTTTKRTTTTLPRPTTTRKPAVVPTTLPPTTTSPPFTITGRAGSRSLTCGSSTSVSATTSEPVSDVVLSWSQTDPASGRTVDSGSNNLNGNAQTWGGTLGPFSQPGTVTWTVSANGKSDSHTISVSDC